MARLPVDTGKVTPTGFYGAHRRTGDHHGLDIAAAPGTAVRAPEGGEVLLVARGLPKKRGVRGGTYERSTSPLVRGVFLGGYGPGALLMRGDSGVVHVLGHLADGALAPLGRVVEGQVVGVVAAGVKPPHVHFEVRRADASPWPKDRRAQDTMPPPAWVVATNKGLDVRESDMSSTSGPPWWMGFLVVALLAWRPTRPRR